MIYKKLKSKNKAVSIDYDAQLPQVIEDNEEDENEKSYHHSQMKR